MPLRVYIAVQLPLHAYSGTDAASGIIAAACIAAFSCRSSSNTVAYTYVCRSMSYIGVFAALCRWAVYTIACAALGIRHGVPIAQAVWGRIPVAHWRFSRWRRFRMAFLQMASLPDKHEVPTSRTGLNRLDDEQLRPSSALESSSLS